MEESSSADLVLLRSAVTTHPAKTIGLDHRIGYLRPGYDADVVVWQSHPLSIGAAPAQVYIDGIPQIDSPVLRSRSEADLISTTSWKFHVRDSLRHRDQGSSRLLS